MLEVGVTNAVVNNTPTLSYHEARTHFAAWCVVSAPLVLSNDLRDKQTMEQIWDIIANEEMIAVNQVWVGDAGTLAAKSSEHVTMPDCGWGRPPCAQPSWMIWKKKLPGNQVALLIMNNDVTTQDVPV